MESFISAATDSENDQTDRGICQTIVRLISSCRTGIFMKMNWSGHAFSAKGSVSANQMNSELLKTLCGIRLTLRFCLTNSYSLDDWNLFHGFKSLFNGNSFDVNVFDGFIYLFDAFIHSSNDSVSLFDNLSFVKRT